MRRSRGWFVFIAAVVLGCITQSVAAAAQEADPVEELSKAVNDEPAIATPAEVDVDTAVSDEQIQARLQKIYDQVARAGWFGSIDVSVEDGVTTLRGVADKPSHRQWAEEFASRTEDVVVVINDLTVQERPWFDLEPASDRLKELGQNAVIALPLLIVSLVILFVFYFLAKLLTALFDRWSNHRIDSQLLQRVVSSVIFVTVMIVGVYIALRISGLGRLAFTVLGGTGLVGLAIGFAFRDIAENYLSSILISLNRPFRVGDLIEVEDYRGFVRRVTTRGTLLLTVDGNHVQIPNSTVYKSVITNHTASPRTRRDFDLGIGYDDSIAEAQRLLHECALEHPAVLSEPSPMILVDSLGASTVNLKVLFWIDLEHYDPIKVTSSLMRQAKTRLIESGISMPDEAREIIFPNGVPVQMLDGSTERSAGTGSVGVEASPEEQVCETEESESQSEAEGGLSAEQPVTSSVEEEEAISGESILT